MTMAARLESIWQILTRGTSREARETPAVFESGPRQTTVETVEITPNDPIVAFCQGNPSILDVDGLSLDSPTLDALRSKGVKLVVPMVSQGELIGLLNIGPRLSGQDYSTDDRRLLQDLSTQAGPAVRVAQMVRQHSIEAQERQRIEQELRVARVIQQTLLPKEVPSLRDWKVAAYYQPAREVGGDFYDFIDLPGDKLGFVVGDVTDKGVPAALVMATTRSVLRASAQRLISPGQVLEWVNDNLCPDIPPNMLVTCLYAVLDPTNGRIQYANAGHDLPYRRTADGVVELRATGMPLGLMPGMEYEEKETTLAPGESVLFYSDGLVEAHSPSREMFSFPRLKELVAAHPGGASLIDHLLAELAGFTGQAWEQEDDVTLVTLQRNAAEEVRGGSEMTSHSPDQVGRDGDRRTLADFELASEPGNEREAIMRIAEALKELDLPGAQLEQLKTAVGEATMNAMEHGNQYRAESPVSILLSASKGSVSVRITDHGGGGEMPEPGTPDLAAKLEGTQTPRGWGLFLIEKMVDEMRVTSDEEHRTVELVVHLKRGEHDVETS